MAIVILCGACSSGKTTLARAIARETTAIVISVDEVIHALNGANWDGPVMDIGITAAAKSARRLSQVTEQIIVVDYAFLTDEGFELFMSQMTENVPVFKLITSEPRRMKYNEAKLRPCGPGMMEQFPPKFPGETLIMTEDFDDEWHLAAEAWRLMKEQCSH